MKTFHLAELIYDVTVRFCDCYVDRRSRTHDQMVQAARSGARNIAEGSQDSATSKKIELKLTGIARGSLEELRLDYEEFLRAAGREPWPPRHPALVRFKARRCSTLEEVREWVHDETRTRTDSHGRTRSGKSVCVGVRPCPRSAELVANAALSLLNICCYLLDRQINSLGAAFEAHGGFTERLNRIRKNYGVTRR